MSKGHWFSQNEDKAWAEKIFLWFIPASLAYNLLVQKNGWLESGTVWHITQNALMWLPYRVFMRRIRTITSNLSGVAAFLAWCAIVAFTAVFWAWAETYMYITDDASANLWYENLDQMLLYGSLFYSLYFLVSFPIYYRLDETEERWSLSRVLIEASALGMLSMLLIDMVSHLMTPLA